MGRARSRSRPGRRPEPWPRTLFVRHAGIYAPYLRARAAFGRREAQGVGRILRRAGIRPPARVLDIACGLGRHVIPLGRAGFRVVGTDLSRTFLAEARRSARRAGLGRSAARFYPADYAHVTETLRRAGEAPFDAAICLFTSIGYRGRAADARVLREIRRVVRPGGLLVWETADLDRVRRHFEPESTLRLDPGLEHRELRTYDRARSEIRSRWTFYRVGRIRRRLLKVEVRVQVYTERTARDLLRHAGWRVTEVYGELIALRQRSRATRRLVLVARRPLSSAAGSRGSVLTPARRPARRCGDRWAPRGPRGTPRHPRQRRPVGPR